MRAIRIALPLVLLTLSLSVTARALPPCESSVDPAVPTTQPVGDFKAHGFGGGAISQAQFPFVDGVTPEATDSEADVTGVQLDLDFVGVLGGGEVSIQQSLGTGPPTLVSGAQKVTAASFTGHYKSQSRFYECQSVLEQNTVHQFNYFEFTLTGVLTPTTAGSPLQDYGQATQIAIQPGDNDAY